MEAKLKSRENTMKCLWLLKVKVLNYMFLLKIEYLVCSFSRNLPDEQWILVDLRKKNSMGRVIDLWETTVMVAEDSHLTE